MSSATVVRTLSPRIERMRAAASGLLLATEVADYLVGRGLPFRTAHEVTGLVVRDLYENGRDFSTLSLADWRGYHDRFDDGVFAAITPEAAVAARRTPQSTNPDAVRRALAETREWLLVAAEPG
jgi:argininosuccinate lyase